MPRLDELLVTCMSYGHPGIHTLQLLLELQGCGATVLLIEGAAGLALARCQTAGHLEKYLHQTNRPDFDYLLLLDDDVSGSVAAVQQLIHLSRYLTIRLGAKPSLGGLYLSRRTKNPTAAAHALKDRAPIACPSAALDAVAIHALCGLGAFLMPIGSFLKHCDESERMLRPPPIHSVPIVCTTTPTKPSRVTDYLGGFERLSLLADEPFWLGEDYDFCLREIEHGRPVLLAPTRFQHTSTQELEPTGPVLFPGLQANP
jgi:hypothetical protein